jgi:hypothetical protein
VMAAATECGFENLLHPPYSPDLALLTSTRNCIPSFVVDVLG